MELLRLLLLQVVVIIEAIIASTSAAAIGHCCTATRKAIPIGSIPRLVVLVVVVFRQQF